MSEPTRDPQAQSNAEGRRRTVAVMPRVEERTTGGKIASFLVHAIAILLLFWPSFNQKMLQINMEGAGGAGPAGGGGGGHKGTGGVREEHVQFVASAPVPAAIPRIIPPIVEPKKPEVVPPPVVAPPQPVKSADSSAKVSTEVTAPTVGVGGGTGNDGTNGTGSGTGGGKGTGVGTGTGSSVGPGTGGGNGAKYKASVTTLVILPMPVPSKIKPYSMEACFEVDSVGHQKLLTWNKSKDESYNRKVEETLKGYRFRPASLPNGTAVRDTSCIKAIGG